MKNLFIAFIFLLFGCHAENRETAVFPEVYESEPDWIIYEGIVPSDSGEEITMELSLRPGSPGYDSDYRLEEWNAPHNMYMMGRNSASKYTTLIGENPDEVIVQLHESKISWALFRGKA